MEAIQDQIRSTCYGCGADNEHGLQVKTFWDGEVATCRWTPEAYHNSGGPSVYGGLLASLIDCHCCNTAMAAVCGAEGQELTPDIKMWYVTATLTVDYLAPTPLGVELELRASVDKIEGRKAWINCSVLAEGTECVRGRGLFVRVKA